MKYTFNKLIIKIISPKLVQYLYPILTMKDTIKNVEGEKSQVRQNDTNKGTVKPTMNKPPVTVNKNNTKTGESSSTRDLEKSSPKGIPENKIINEDKRARPISKKVTFPEEKISIEKSPGKGKTEGENRVQNKVKADDKSKKETEKTNSGEKQNKKIIIIKKNAKKAEEKVVKLKKKVKKTINKDVKINQHKGLKEKFKDAFERLKSSIKKLKKAKK